jgi:hypothetical protein
MCCGPPTGASNPAAPQSQRAAQNRGARNVRRVHCRLPALLPLTHHQILALVRPFVLRGRAIDLAGSDRLAHQLRFRPVVHAAQDDGTPALTEILSLEPGSPLDRPASPHRLRRRLHTEAGLQAELEAEGSDLDELLDRVLAVPPAAHFRLVAGGVRVALSHRLPPAADAHASAQPSPALVLRSATAPLGGLTLKMKVSGVRGYRAELELLSDQDPGPQLPYDLLAVLSRPWHRLDAIGRGWRSGISLRGAEPRRSREAEARLLRTVEHLATTLAETPERFHLRHRRARWAVALQALLPLAVGLGVLAFAWGMQGLGPGYDSMLGAVANIAPPILLGMLFLRPEMPRVGLPRIPLPPRSDAWQPRRLPPTRSEAAPRPPC